MRISDWSSDVCSSDLWGWDEGPLPEYRTARGSSHRAQQAILDDGLSEPHPRHQRRCEYPASSVYDNDELSPRSLARRRGGITSGQRGMLINHVQGEAKWVANSASPARCCWPSL